MLAFNFWATPIGPRHSIRRSGRRSCLDAMEPHGVKRNAKPLVLSLLGVSRRDGLPGFHTRLANCAAQRSAASRWRLCLTPPRTPHPRRLLFCSFCSLSRPQHSSNHGGCQVRPLEEPNAPCSLGGRAAAGPAGGWVGGRDCQAGLAGCHRGLALQRHTRPTC